MKMGLSPQSPQLQCPPCQRSDMKLDNSVIARSPKKRNKKREKTKKEKNDKREKKKERGKMEKKSQTHSIWAS